MFGLWIITQECRIIGLIKMMHYGSFLFALPCKAICFNPFKEVVKVVLSDRERENINGLIKKKMLQTSFKKT